VAVVIVATTAQNYKITQVKLVYALHCHKVTINWNWTKV